MHEEWFFGFFFFHFLNGWQEKNQKDSISWHKDRMWNSNFGVHNKDLLGQLCPLVYLLSLAAFQLQGQGGWSHRDRHPLTTKLKMFPTWPFMEKVANL